MATDASSFSSFVPGFEFLQGLVKNAGAALPGIGQWVAPTLDPAELDKRIEELRTVQFWLEQNARMLGATIQALEVQRMTLSTLQTMNVQMGDLRESLRVKVPERAAPEPVAAPAPASAFAKAGGKAAAEPAATGSDAGPDSGTKPAAAAGAVDPMQWWGALTRQFTELASQAIQDGAGGAARKAADTLVQQSIDATGEAFRAAAAMPAATVKQASAAMRKAVSAAPAAPASSAPARKRPVARKRSP